MMVSKPTKDKKATCRCDSGIGRGVSSDGRQSKMVEFFPGRLSTPSTPVDKKRKITFAQCLCGSCKECRLGSEMTSVPIGESVSSAPIGESVSSAPIGESVTSVPVVQHNTETRGWWSHDWNAHLPERLQLLAEMIYPHPRIVDSYKITGDDQTLMLRMTEHGVGVFVDATPAVDLRDDYAVSGRRRTLRSPQSLDGRVVYEVEDVIVEYVGKTHVGAVPGSDLYTFERSSGKRVRAVGDGSSYGPLINEGWERNNSYLEEGRDGKSNVKATTTLCHPEQVFAQYGLLYWRNGDHSPELKAKAEEYYRTHPENFGAPRRGDSKRKYSPVTATVTVPSEPTMSAEEDPVTASDYDKWEDDAGLVCFPFRGFLSSDVVSIATVASTTSKLDYYISLAITEERQDPVLRMATGRHMAMNDGGANLHVSTSALALLLQSMGFRTEANPDTVKIRTADKGASLVISAWIDVGGYIGRMAVVESALYNATGPRDGL